MALLQSITQRLDTELKTATVAEYPGAVNGLQLANEGEVTRIVAAVDASLPVIEAAVRGGRDSLLIVHHGLFWQGVQPYTGALYRKLKVAMDAGLAVYSSHLPLDIHPRLGNNAVLAREIGLLNCEPFFEQKGQFSGIRGNWSGTRDDLHERMKLVLQGPVHLCTAGPVSDLKVGLITGGAGSEIAAVAATGVDTFITGEGPHWSFPIAEELNINVMYGGHYATETWGVKALTQWIAARFQLPWAFLDRPTGL